MDLIATEAQKVRIRRFEEAEAFGDDVRAFTPSLLVALKEAALVRWQVCPKHGQRAESGVSGNGRCLAKYGKRKCQLLCPRIGLLKMSPRELIVGLEKCAKVSATTDVILHAHGFGKRPVQNLTINQDNRALLVDLKNAPPEVQAWHVEQERKRALGIAAGVVDAVVAAPRFEATTMTPEMAT